MKSAGSQLDVARGGGPRTLAETAFGDRENTSRKATFVTLTILVATGAALSLVGGPPWLLIVASGIALTGALGQFMPWATALVSAVALSLISLLAVLRVLPQAGLDISIALVASLVLIGLGSILFLTLFPGGARLPSSNPLRLGVQSLVFPLVVLAVANAVSLVSNGTRLSWGMSNDAATNTMLARRMWSDGGIDSLASPNPSPLTQALLVAIWAPGRNGLSSTELLGHDLQRNAQLWVVMIALASFFAALLVVRGSHGHTSVVRITAGALASGVTLSWYALGTAFQFGFMNAPLVMALLFGVWIVWTDTRHVPMVGLAGFALLSTALLASWAPLAVIPLVLYAGYALSHPGQLWRQSSVPQRLLAAFCSLQLALYVLLVTVPDFLRSSGSLSVNGGMAPMSPGILVVTAAVLVVVATVGWVFQGDLHSLFGVALLGLGGAFAVGFLVYQRRAAESLWGYYPAKLSWFIAILFMVMIVGVLMTWRLPAVPRGRRLAILSLSAITTFSLLVQLPPTRTTLDIGLSFADLRPGLQPDSVDEAVVDLVSISNPQSRDLAVRLGNFDQFLNLWLIHMTVPEETDPIRLFGYVGNPNDIDQVCAAIGSWGGGVTLHTRDLSLEDSMRQSCHEDFTVRIVE